MSEENVKKEVDVLDDFRKVERAVKQRSLAFSMKLLKEKAATIMRFKEESIALLEALGIQELDIKRVIDFVNSLPDVQLSEFDRRKIKEEMREEGKKQKKKAADKIEDSPYIERTSVDIDTYRVSDNIRWTTNNSPQIRYRTSVEDSVYKQVETFCSTVN